MLLRRFFIFIFIFSFLLVSFSFPVSAKRSKKIKESIVTESQSTPQLDFQPQPLLPSQPTLVPSGFPTEPQSVSQTQIEAVTVVPKKIKKAKVAIQKKQDVSVATPVASDEELQGDADKNDVDEVKVEADDTLMDEVEDDVSQEETVINAMLKGDFPDKTEFIRDEDKKNTSTLLVPTPPKSEPTEFSYGAMIKKMSVSTLMIAGVVLVLAYIWKILRDKSFRIFPGNEVTLRVVSQQVIAPKSRILIVEAYGKKYLLGATQDHITLLSDIDFYTDSNGNVSAKDKEFIADGPRVPSVDSVASSSIIESQKQTSHSQMAASSFSDKSFIPLTTATAGNFLEVKTVDKIKERIKGLKKMS